LSADEANQHCKAGASIWNNYSTEGGRNPDVVLVGIGVETTAEVISASELLRGINKDKDNDNESSGLRVRVVNITDLMILSEGSSHPHALSEEMFEALFTNEKPIVVSFHGYPSAVKGLLGDRLARKLGRRPTSILGFVEEGTTTTPWSMLKVNGVDRFTVACKAMELVDQDAKLIEERGHRANDRIAKLISTQHFNKLGQRFQQRRREWEVFISENGYDPPEASE
jgi:xylulose-5-phosphate/fructose-6-phosphate phosphoketolase